jgi:4-amino-4-deoxy-L-arabinose transferase-like glycosyltransferase
LREGLGATDAPRADRRWLAAVLVFFCLPLFVNLGNPDLDNDEAIYSFAVDRMVSTGDWLVPRMIGTTDGAFLEKPPLKFWIVALPIRLGWLPSDEFGLRFWDALFGAASFVYVFLIGSWLLNPICGFVSVLLLFAHAPLLFSHGLRSNAMDSALVLAYCGGVYHYLRWTGPFVVRTSIDERSNVRTTNGTVHVLAAALFFVLGFMTKFVAAAFLPVILGLTAVLVREHRRQLARDWRTWMLAAAVAAALIVPWFAFAWLRFGSALWQTILGVHVYQRFTATLDPGHLQPWHYYFGQMFDFWETGALVLIAGGFGLVAGWTSRRYAPSAAVFLFWLLPIAAISAVTSKLYHYVFPFLPALALMGGYFAAIVPAVGWASFDRGLERAYGRAEEAWPGAVGLVRRRPVRAVLALALAACAALAAGSLLFGRVELTVGNVELTSAGVLRPGLAAFMFGTLLMPARRYRRWLLTLLVGCLLPLQGYRDSLVLLAADVHPRRSVSACISSVQAGGMPRGLRVDNPVETISHSVLYYFERIRPWRHGPDAGDVPALIKLPRPGSDGDPARVALLDIGEGMAVILPPTYSACADGPAAR